MRTSHRFSVRRRPSRYGSDWAADELQERAQIGTDHIAGPSGHAASRQGPRPVRFATLPKPHVLDVYEWEEWRQQRAELMTLAPGSPCSPTDTLRHAPDLPDRWWTQLRRTIEAVAATPTDRVHSDQALVTGRIQQHFGNSVNPVVHQWETVHGNLHWANLMGPDFGLLDWELWGRGPAGTDAPTLYCYSLLVPDTAERVRDTFAHVLDTDAGQLALFYVTARLLHLVSRPQTASPSGDRASPRLAINALDSTHTTGSYLSKVSRVNGLSIPTRAPIAAGTIRMTTSGRTAMRTR